jgi:hypothetical protein
MSRPNRRQNSPGSNGSVKIVNMRSRNRIKQLSTGSANSGPRDMDVFWNGIDEAEYHAQKATNEVPSSRRRTKQASQSSESSNARVHDDLPPYVGDEQQQRQSKKGEEDEEKETARATVDLIIEPASSHGDKKRASRPSWKFLFRKGG